MGIDQGWEKATATPVGLSGMSQKEGSVLSLSVLAMLTFDRYDVLVNSQYVNIVFDFHCLVYIKQLRHGGHEIR